ncbi:DNA primase [Lactobacillus colini]|uniref:DNA primase n=1 Tax=Lactobacillus colini TaxID=1819254 RepID=A0ABS4MBL7_9LACO|nr:DNA primase [Lactobacillus colini]MBP2057059.1 DNA primase [Lactobacillus colini]
MAGRIPENFINEVRNSVNIVDVISQYVSLEKKGKDYIGLCPFHQEKTPSFTVSESKQFFKCFGCGKGGNVFKFMMYKENLNFPESVKAVAKFANVTMPEGIGMGAAKLSPLKQMYKEATEFYHHILMTTKIGQRARDYAAKRQLNEDLLQHFNIGYAPNNENILLTYLRQQGYENKLLEESGLFVKSQQGELFDRFRDRLMFPLADEGGYTVGFSGRRISDDPEVAKYMNSPETEIFNKSKLLFHFFEAKKAARSENRLILYEGYMDVIAAYRAGIKSGVASMGTSLTEDQVYMLRRITPNIIINYDGDNPGVHAAERATKLFDKVPGFNLGIVVLPDNLDPDEYVKKYGVERYQGEIAGALAPLEFLLKRLASKYNLQNDREKLAYINEAIKLIAQVNDPVANDLYIEKLAKQTSATRESLKASLLREQRRLRQVQRHKTVVSKANNSDPPQIDLAPIHEDEDPAIIRLFYLFIHSEESRKYLLSKRFLFPDESYAELAELWLKYHQSHENADIKGFVDFIPDRLQEIVANVEMTDMPPEYSKKEVDDQLESLRRKNIRKKLANLQSEIKEAQIKQDNATVLKLVSELITLKRQVN